MLRNSDGFSKVPLPTSSVPDFTLADLFMLEQGSPEVSLPAVVHRKTIRDPLLSQFVRVVHTRTPLTMTGDWDLLYAQEQQTQSTRGMPFVGITCSMILYSQMFLNGYMLDIPEWKKPR